MYIISEPLAMFADIVGVLGAIFSFLIWLQLRQERSRKDRKITIILQFGHKAIKIPLKLRRGDATRAEILGYIGMIPIKKPGRFSIAYLGNSEFSDQLDSILKGHNDMIFTIPLSENEYDQFDLTQFPPK